MGLVSAFSLSRSAICRVSSCCWAAPTDRAAASHPSWPRGTLGKASLGVCGGDACRPLHLRSEAAASAHRLPLPAGKEAPLAGTARAALGFMAAEGGGVPPKGDTLRKT